MMSRQAKKEAVLAKLAERRRLRTPRRTTSMREPRYDDVYVEGLRWLDEIGEGVERSEDEDDG
jgi:hypothetical protein